MKVYQKWTNPHSKESMYSFLWFSFMRSKNVLMFSVRRLKSQWCWMSLKLTIEFNIFNKDNS